MYGQVTYHAREHQSRERFAAVIAVIAIDLLALVAIVTQSEVLGRLFLPGMGIVLLAWGLFVHEYTLTGLGCIATGMGLGLGPLGLAVGFLALAMIGPWFMKTSLWPLIVAAILGLIGTLPLVLESSPGVASFVTGLMSTIASGLLSLAVLWPVVFAFICVIVYLQLRQGMNQR